MDFCAEKRGEIFDGQNSKEQHDLVLKFPTTKSFATGNSKSRTCASLRWSMSHRAGRIWGFFARAGNAHEIVFRKKWVSFL